jgi:hypothetical protein
MEMKFKIHNDTNSNCSFCGEEKKHEEQRWHLSDYFGFNGTACHECYYKIAHDAYGNPRNPEEFVMMVLKHVNH